MVGKRLVIFLVFVILLSCCIEKEKLMVKYICPDSSVVSDPRICQPFEPEIINVTKYVCADGKIFENSADCEISATITTSGEEMTANDIMATTTIEEEFAAEKNELTTIAEKTTTTKAETTTKRTTTTAKITTTSTIATTTQISTTTTHLTTTTTQETTTTIEGNEVIISDMQFEATSGSDRDYLNEEWIEITNGKNSDVDMTGWTLNDESGKTYDFPSGFVLPAGNSVKIHTGSGTDTSSDLYWNYKSPIWNNDGDTATLKDNNGDIVDQKTG